MTQQTKLLKIKKIFNSPCKNFLESDLKVNALASVTWYLVLIRNGFFMLEVKYCQLVWMCNNSTKSYKINRLHKRCLRLIYDTRSSFQELLRKDSSVSLHNRNLRALVTEIYKICQDILGIINQIFTLKNQNQHNLWNWSDFCIPKIRSVSRNSESVSYLSPKVWEIIAA